MPITSIRFWIGKGSIAAGGVLIFFYDKFGHVVAAAGPCTTDNCYAALWALVTPVLPAIMAILGGITWEFISLKRPPVQHPSRDAERVINHARQ